jgi:LacI family transcriptional regulator
VTSLSSINDVARLVGVSITTVSKVLNGYPDVSPKTRKKVLEIINELKFQPNVVARGLVKGRSWSLGIFLTTSFDHPFVSGVMGGMKETLENSGYDLIYLAQGSKDPDYDFLKHCHSRNVDGVVVFGFSREDKNLMELVKSELPSVFIDTNLTGKRAGYITSDNRSGIFMAMEHLYRLGHRKIAFISSMQWLLPGRVRFEAYLEGLRKFSLPYVSDYMEIREHYIFTKENGYESMRRMLALKERPTSVVCGSDLMAIGAMAACQEAGLKVGRDMAIVGFDDIELASHTVPKLTTIRQDFKLIGKKSIEHLISMIKNPHAPPPIVEVPTQLIIRESCGDTKN